MIKDYWIAKRLREGDRIERPGRFTPSEKRRTVLVLALVVAAAVARSVLG